MDCRLEEISSPVCFVGKTFTVNTIKALREIPDLWRAARDSGLEARLWAYSAANAGKWRTNLVGVCGNTAVVRTATFSYFLGAETQAIPPDGLEVLELPPAVWAVFAGGIRVLQEVRSVWLPASGYRLREEVPCFECYVTTKPPAHLDLWVPVIQK